MYFLSKIVNQSTERWIISRNSRYLLNRCFKPCGMSFLKTNEWICCLTSNFLLRIKGSIIVNVGDIFQSTVSMALCKPKIYIKGKNRWNGIRRRTITIHSTYSSHNPYMLCVKKFNLLYFWGLQNTGQFPLIYRQYRINWICP